MGGVAKGVALVLGLGTAAATALSSSVEDDPRVGAFTQAYDTLIDSVAYGEEDVVFYLGRHPIHFEGGRMLEEGRLDGRQDCDPIFYFYSLEPLHEPLPRPPDELPTYCTDVLESLWGREEDEIRQHGRSITFLDHRMFVNQLLVDPLASVEREILQASADDGAMDSWIEELNVTYSFFSRGIAGSSTQSYHAWGMAVDLVPTSYAGRQVYWRWSRALDREGWYRIPLERRWSPPTSVIQAFERHGFVWGGKWPHFDAIHFEYRPEILLYNRMIQDVGRGPDTDDSRP